MTAMASSSPPPSARPFMAAITGFGEALDEREQIVQIGRGEHQRRKPNSLTSAPPQKFAPDPMITTATDRRIAPPAFQAVGDVLAHAPALSALTGGLFEP
jgi:hypothetical protein